MTLTEVGDATDAVKRAIKPRNVRTPRGTQCARIWEDRQTTVPETRHAYQRSQREGWDLRLQKPSKTNTQEEPKTAETATNREDLNNVEMTHIAEQPKPQRVRSRLPRLKEVELVDRPAAEILSEPKQREEGKSQDTRDREKRAVKIQKAKRVTGRHTESEEEDDEQMCEPEDSRHDEPKD